MWDMYVHTMFCSIEDQVTKIMHKAFWDALQEKLNQTPPDYSHAIILLSEVKEVSHMLIQYGCALHFTVVQ